MISGGAAAAAAADSRTSIASVALPRRLLLRLERGGGPAAAVVFGRDVRARALADARVAELAKRASGSEEARALYERTLAEVTLEKQAEVAEEFDAVHSVERAREVGSLEAIIKAMSPTTLEVGVTLTMSPNSWLTSA